MRESREGNRGCHPVGVSGDAAGDLRPVLLSPGHSPGESFVQGDSGAKPDPRLRPVGAPDTPVWVYVAGSDFAAENPEVVTAWLDATKRGAEWAAEGFGTLGRAYETALLATLLGLGIQVVFSAFFLALLTMPLASAGASDAHLPRL